MTTQSPITDEALDAADAAFMAHNAFDMRSCVRAALEAAAPLITAPLVAELVFANRAIEFMGQEIAPLVAEVERLKESRDYHLCDADMNFAKVQRLTAPPDEAEIAIAGMEIREIDGRVVARRILRQFLSNRTKGGEANKPGTGAKTEHSEAPHIAQPPVEDAGGEGRIEVEEWSPEIPPFAGDDAEINSALKGPFDTSAYIFLTPLSPPPSPVADAIAESTAELTRSTSAAKAHLVALGTHTENGELTPEYGGPAPSPVAEDRTRFERLAPEKPALMPEGYSAPLEIKTTREMISERLAAQSTPSPVAGGGETYAKPAHGWTCFHCGETFTTFGSARDHFGATPNAEPGCLIKVRLGEERGLLMALRKAEAVLASAPVAMPEWAELSDDQRRAIHHEAFVWRRDGDTRGITKPLYEAIRRAITPPGVE